MSPAASVKAQPTVAPESRPAQPGPSFQDLHARLRGNLHNYVEYSSASGRIKRPFAAVYDDIVGCLETFRAVPGLDQKPVCLLSGAPSYKWLLGALGAMFSGLRLIVLPESTPMALMKGAMVIDDVGVALVDKQLAATLPPGSYGVRYLNDMPPSNADATGRVVKDPPAFCCRITAFTSGTTSATALKGYELNPQSILAFGEHVIDAFHLRADDRWVVCHSFSHIFHFEYVLVCLWYGLNVVLCTPAEVVARLERLGPSIMVSIPGLYYELDRRMQTLLRERQLRYGVFRLCMALRDWLPLALQRKIGQIVFLPAVLPLVRRPKGLIVGAAPSSSDVKVRLNLMGLPIFEAYGSSEAGMVACNLPGANRRGVVGQPWPGVEVRLSPERVLQVRPNPPRTFGYINVSAEQAISTFLPDGWVDTGDIASIDRDGFIAIDGRQKEILITDRAEKVNVARLEVALEALEPIARAVVVGERRPFVVALLNVRPGFSDEEARAEVERLNHALPSHERIRRTAIIGERFAEDPRYVTTSGKLRRSAIVEGFARAIDALYAPSDGLPRP